MIPYVTMLGTKAYALDSKVDIPPLESPIYRPAPLAHRPPWRSTRAVPRSDTSSSRSSRSANTLGATFSHAFPTIVVVPPLAAPLRPNESEAPPPARPVAARPVPLVQEQPLATAIGAQSSSAAGSTAQLPPKPIAVDLSSKPVVVEYPPKPIVVESSPKLSAVELSSKPVVVEYPPKPIVVESSPKPSSGESLTKHISEPSSKVTALAIPLPRPPLPASVPSLSDESSPPQVSVTAGDSHHFATACSVDKHNEMAGNGFVYCPKCGSQVRFDSSVTFSRDKCLTPHERELRLAGDFYCILCGAALVQRESRDETKLPLRGPAARAVSHPSHLSTLEKTLDAVVNSAAQRSEAVRDAPHKCEVGSIFPEPHKAVVGLPETHFARKQDSAGASIVMPKSMHYTAAVPGVTCGLPHCSLCTEQTSQRFNYPTTALKRAAPSRHVSVDQHESKSKVVVIHNHYYSA